MTAGRVETPGPANSSQENTVQRLKNTDSLRRILACLLAASAMTFGACDDGSAVPDEQTELDEEQEPELVELAPGLALVIRADGREGYQASDMQGARALLGFVESGETEMTADAHAHLRGLVEGPDRAPGGTSPRSLPSCPSSAATTSVYQTSFGIWGVQYVARAQRMKIGFGPHAPAYAESLVCTDSDCVVDSAYGTPLDVIVATMVPLSDDTPVTASAKVMNYSRSCIQSAAFQHWP